MHSNEHLGLQSHSFGDLYPWSVVAYRDGDSSYVRGENLVSGERLSTFFYSGEYGRSFIQAHRLAEREIQLRLSADRDYVAAMQDLAELGYPPPLDPRD